MSMGSNSVQGANWEQAILTRGMFRLGPAKLLAKTEEAKSAASA